jgi:hypothetical protein
MFPHERSLVKKMEGKPFALIGVNSDSDKKALKEAMEKDQITWRSFWDKNTGGPIASSWNIHGWPTLYVIDDKGVIRHKWVGSPGEKIMDESIEKLVADAAGSKEPKK